MDSQPLNFQSVGSVLCVEGRKLYRWYKEVLSGFTQPQQQEKLHRYDIKEKRKNGDVYTVSVPILKQENMGVEMCVDEKKIGDSMYTILTNRTTGKIALLAETLKINTLAEIMRHFGTEKFAVKSITRDLSESYKWFSKQVFMNAKHVADKFHVLGHLFEASQSIRVYYRQKFLSEKREKYEEHKKKEFERAGQCMNQKKPFKPKEFDYKEPRYSNGETPRELLARSRYLLYKYPHQWTTSQSERAEILFEQYPEIKKVYDLSCDFRNWFSKKNIAKDKDFLTSELYKWYSEVDQTGIEEILNFKSLVERNQTDIMNYFDEGETNALAEAINSKIQQFIQTNKGVKDKDFFFFRLKNYYT